MPIDLLDRIVIIRTLPYTPSEIVQVCFLAEALVHSV